MKIHLETETELAYPLPLNYAILFLKVRGIHEIFRDLKLITLKADFQPTKVLQNGFKT